MSISSDLDPDLNLVLARLRNVITDDSSDSQYLRIGALVYEYGIERLIRLFEAIKDARTVAGYVSGWWPALEDGISWPANDDDDLVVAARRFLDAVN